jgi:hypothetical protein
VDLDEVLAATSSLIGPHLTARQRGLPFGAAARALGYGGVSRVARLAEASRPTVRRGAAELDQPADPRGRIHQHQGPKRLGDRDPGLLAALDRLVEPDTPDRDAQFRYLNEQAHTQLAAGQPVVSVDAKKKELVGRFANGDREWQPTGEPDQVNVHDFPDPTLGRAIPYGAYDLGRNTGWVGVGTDHDTAAFAVQTLRRWWQQGGRSAYPEATRLLGLCRCRWFQWLPGQGMEDRAGPARHRDRAGDHRVSPAAGNLQVEPERAPTVQRDLDELARPAADKP